MLFLGLALHPTLSCCLRLPRAESGEFEHLPHMATSLLPLNESISEIVDKLTCRALSSLLLLLPPQEEAVQALVFMVQC